MNEMSKKEKMDARYPIQTNMAEEQGSYMYPIRNQIRDVVQLAYVLDPTTHHLYITSLFALLVGLSLLVLGHDLDGIGPRADSIDRCRCRCLADAGVHFRKPALHNCNCSDTMRYDQMRTMDVDDEAWKMKQSDRPTIRIVDMSMASLPTDTKYVLKCN